MRWFLPFLICTVGPLQAMAKAAPPASKEQAASIGVRTLKYEDEKRGRPVLVELWHPTGVKGPIDQPSDPVWEHPKEVRNVPLSEGKFPIVIMSHGHGGGGVAIGAGLLDISSPAGLLSLRWSITAIRGAATALF